MEKINFEGYFDFLTNLKDGLVTKKCVALFDNYEDAVNDLLLDFYPNSPEQSEKANKVIEHLNEITNIKEWFNKI